MALRQKLFLALQWAIPQHALSRLVARLARSHRLRRPLIAAFRLRFGISLDEAQIQNPQQFEHFNAFFTRALKAGTRPVDGRADSIVSPADGIVSECGLIQQDRLLQAKGQWYSLQQLLGGEALLADRFRDGSFATIYLSPKDYHRVHMPLTGRLERSIFLPGALFSVNQATAAAVPGLFARNERLVCLFDTPAGSCAVILVGAMIVAGIETVWGHHPVPGQRFQEDRCWGARDIRLGKGQEMGRFLLGSTVILLFQSGRCQWHESMKPGQTLRFGEAIGTWH